MGLEIIHEAVNTLFNNILGWRKTLHEDGLCSFSLIVEVRNILAAVNFWCLVKYLSLSVVLGESDSDLLTELLSVFSWNVSYFTYCITGLCVWASVLVKCHQVVSAAFWNPAAPPAAQIVCLSKNQIFRDNVGLEMNSSVISVIAKHPDISSTLLVEDARRQ